MIQKILTALAVIALPFSLAAQPGGDVEVRIGGMSRAEFDRINAAGAAEVAAVTPTPDPLSQADKKLFTLMAQGGMMQLQVSQAALDKLSSEDARILAQSEVEEQTGLSRKLGEIAAAKGIAMPSEPMSGTAAILAQIGARSGTALDAYYIKTSGVDGHLKLETAMSVVSRTAQDPALKAVAAAALPQVRTHLKVSRNLSAGKSGSMATRARGRK